MLCVNWVCEGAFDDHEWVSESTTAMREEEVMGRELDYEICNPCVVQWCTLWLSALTLLKHSWEGEKIKIEKYHEIVDMTIAEPISLPFGRSHTSQTCMLTTVAAILHCRPSSNGDVNNEMKGSRMEGRLVLLLDVDGGDKEVFLMKVVIWNP